MILGCYSPKFITDRDLTNSNISNGELGEDYFLISDINGVLGKDKLRLSGRVLTDLGFPVKNIIVKSSTKDVNDTFVEEKILGQSDSSGYFNVNISIPSGREVLLIFHKDNLRTNVYNISNLVKNKRTEMH